MREAPLLNEILVQINRIPGVRAWRQNSGLLMAGSGRMVRAGVPGCADITGVVICACGCGVGTRLEIEVKSHGVNQSSQQKLFQEMISLHGGTYIVARTVDEAINGVHSARHRHGA